MRPSSTTLPEEEPQSAPLETPQPALFLVFECDGPRAGPARYLLGAVDEVTVGRGSRAARIEEEGRTRRLRTASSDPRISATHFHLRRVGGEWELVDAGAKNGTFVNGRKIQTMLLADGDLIEAGRTLFIYRRALGATGPAMLDGGSLDRSIPGFATLMPRLEAEFGRLRAVAADSLSIAIHGESGTGKELLAAAVHRLSGRPGPFLALNCGALPPTLIASELFGYRKGAFSGADQDRPGLFRSADRGTLFLDEIADLQPEAQAALLRTLQEREVLPIGATRPIKVDVRVVCASSREFGSLVREGRFRRDLYERLAGYTATLPPLRQRIVDVGLIALSLLRKLDPAGADAVRFTPDAARALLRYDWPGNVRELENCLRAALLLASGRPISLQHLPAGPRQAVQPHADPAARVPPPLSETHLKLRRELSELLTATAGNVSAVARRLGKDRAQVQRWLRRLDLDARAFRR
jgi:DNA-binding NtrC family response regulator